jgi:hypothetical protein
MLLIDVFQHAATLLEPERVFSTAKLIYSSQTTSIKPTVSKLRIFFALQNQCEQEVRKKEYKGSREGVENCFLGREMFFL